MGLRRLPLSHRRGEQSEDELVDKLHAICVLCGAPACRNQRLIDGRPAPAEGPTIQVGGAESYEARCRLHHEVPSAPA